MNSKDDALILLQLCADSTNKEEFLTDIIIPYLYKGEDSSMAKTCHHGLHSLINTQKRQLQQIDDDEFGPIALELERAQTSGDDEIFNLLIQPWIQNKALYITNIKSKHPRDFFDEIRKATPNNEMWRQFTGYLFKHDLWDVKPSCIEKLLLKHYNTDCKLLKKLEHVINLDSQELNCEANDGIHALIITLVRIAYEARKEFPSCLDHMLNAMLKTHLYDKKDVLKCCRANDGRFPIEHRMPLAKEMETLFENIFQK